VSECDKKRGLENKIAKHDSYQIVRYGIDKTQFQLKDSNIRSELGLRDNDIIVGSISCFKPQKSPEDFVKLAALINHALPNTKFLLIGDGILRSKIESLISRNNLNKQIVLTGWRRDIPRLLSAMDIFVLTSLWEGLPISVLEAMSASVPVVATNTGGIQEIIFEGTNGYLVPSRDVTQMTDEVIGLLKDESLRRRIGGRARISIGDGFSVSAMTENTHNLYQGLLSQKGAPYAH